MNRATASISLKDKHTRSLRVGRVVLDHDRGLDTIDHLTSKDTVFRDLIVAMRGNPKNALSPRGERARDQKYDTPGTCADAPR